MAVSIGPKLGIDGEKEYRDSINQIIQQAKTLGSEMKLVTASFDENTEAEEKAQRTAEVLNKQIDVQKKRVDALNGMLEKSADLYGENDTKTLKWQEAVNDANAELKNTKGYHAGWLNIAMGYGFGVMFPVLMFGGVSGAHINPAMTLAQAVNGMFPWNEVLPYIIAQLLGAVAGQLIVYVTYLPHYKDTDDAEAILGTFCTTDAHNDRVNYFLNEFFGTFMLVLGALCCLSLPWGKANPAAASIVVGFIVWGLVTSMGGPTGPGLNPARDLMPRLLHAIQPIPNKGDSRWGEAWIPVVAPIAGAIVGAFLFKVLFA